MALSAAGPLASEWRVTKTGQEFNSQSQILFVDDQTGWILSDKQILKITDGGTTWVVLSQNLPDSYKVVKLCFADRLHGWAAGKFNRQAAIWETSDGGTSWKLQYSVPHTHPQAMTPGVMMDIRFADQSHGWAVGGNQADAIIVATTDGGQHWTPQYSGSEITTQFNLVRVWDSLHVWVMGDDAV
ncbi:MAG TPA: YCF48-related protein, partial [Bryobacteraceae bacterium]|nr:YCF48-related protein [Bryobacteraceae bacterium]